MTNEIFNILVIDDDKSEQKLLKMIIKNSRFSSALKFLNDGEEAILFIEDFPNGDDLFRNINLIFLDLNLPKIDGIKVLESLRRKEALKRVPVVVLTTSSNHSDVQKAYAAGASGYVRKPAVIDDYEKIIFSVLHYWFEICLTA